MTAQNQCLNARAKSFESCECGIGDSRNRIVIERDSLVSSDRLQAVGECRESSNAVSNSFRLGAAQCRRGDGRHHILQVEFSRKRYLRRINYVIDGIVDAERPQGCLAPPCDLSGNGIVPGENKEIIRSLEFRYVLLCC